MFLFIFNVLKYATFVDYFKSIYFKLILLSPTLLVKNLCTIIGNYEIIVATINKVFAHALLCQLIGWGYQYSKSMAHRNIFHFHKQWQNYKNILSTIQIDQPGLS